MNPDLRREFRAARQQHPDAPLALAGPAFVAGLALGHGIRTGFGAGWLAGRLLAGAAHRTGGLLFGTEAPADVMSLTAPVNRSPGLPAAA